MYKETLRAIAGIEVFPVISLLLFVTVFTVVLIWTLRLDAARVRLAEQLPFDDGAPGGGPAASEGLPRSDS